jgi:hypothetical protein
MSRRRLTRVGVPALAVVLATAVVVPALAGQGQAPRRATLPIKGGVEVKINRFISDKLRFGRDSTDIRSGGTVVVRNPTDQPHTVSVVRRGQLPRNTRGVERCFEGPPCSQFFEAHQVNDQVDPPEIGQPVVNAGQAGVNQPGDSVFIPPKGRTNLNITADRGTTLYFLCAPHPWMQSRFRVR